MPTTSLQERLAHGENVSQPVAVVAAHPDDEVVWMGSRLQHLQHWRLIHLTDGAPRDLQDARRAGFDSWQEYAAARRLELRRALQEIHGRPEQCINYNIADQQSAYQLVGITERLTADLAGLHVVFTHAYEHGHPDHDSAAFAVHAGCALLRRMGRAAPHVVEFAAYHVRAGQLVCGCFWPEPQFREAVACLTAADRIRKTRAIDCFVSQREVLQRFVTSDERLRAAPAYDFTQPAPPAQAWYDSLEWTVSSTVWRGLAVQSLQQLELHGAL